LTAHLFYRQAHTEECWEGFMYNACDKLNLKIISWTINTIYILQSPVPNKNNRKIYNIQWIMLHYERQYEMRPNADPNISVPGYIHKE
jgi:hypothetical protein